MRGNPRQEMAKARNPKVCPDLFALLQFDSCQYFGNKARLAQCANGERLATSETLSPFVSQFCKQKLMLITISPISLVISILAVWRVTHLFWGEDGPWDLIVRLRRLAGNTVVGSLLDCFYCLSLWMAAPLAWLLGHMWLERGLLWLAFSAGAILLERISAERPEPEKLHDGPTRDASESRSLANAPPAVWHEEPLPADPRKEG